MNAFLHPYKNRICSTITPQHFLNLSISQFHWCVSLYCCCLFLNASFYFACTFAIQFHFVSRYYLYIFSSRSDISQYTHSLSLKLQIMAAKLKACQEIMPPPHQQHLQQQQQLQQQQPQRRKYGSMGIQSSSLKSLNGSLNTSRISVANDLDESDTSHRKTTAI